MVKGNLEGMDGQSVLPKLNTIIVSKLLLWITGVCEEETVLYHEFEIKRSIGYK